jgi:hypothetical protein
MATATTVRVPCTAIGNISHCQILPFHDYEASSELAQHILDAQRKLIGNIFCRIGPEGDRRLKILAMERVDSLGGTSDVVDDISDFAFWRTTVIMSWKWMLESGIR